jgi:DNA polymerase-1
MTTDTDLGMPLIAPLAAAETVAEPPSETNARHLILVDGSGYIFRAFHALPPMTRGDGTPVNAVFGFTNMLARFLRDHIGTHLAVVFDAGSKTFRNRIYDLYKAQRPEPPAELIPQFKLVRDATAAFGVACVELVDWEADDLIATYARVAAEEGIRVTIVSSDKDLMQLVRPGVSMMDPIKQKPLGEAEVFEKFGVVPGRVVDVQALMGDSVDNVPGVPGIGPKGAAELIQAYGDLESVLAAAPGMKASKRRDNLIAHAESARISRKLVELCDQVPLPLPVEALEARPINRTQLADFLHSMGFRSTALRLGLEPGAEAPAAAGASADEAPAKTAAYGPYDIISTAEALSTLVQKAISARRVALHVQTDGNPRPLQAALLGVAFATDAGRAAYLPLPTAELTEPRLPLADTVEILAPLLADASVLKIIANAKYAQMVLVQAGLPAPWPIDDPCLIAYAQSAGAHEHNFATLAPQHLGHTPKSLDETTGTGRNRLTFAQVPVGTATAYAAEQADIAWRLEAALRPGLRTNHALSLYEQIERRLIPVLARMETAGIRIDEAELRRMSIDFGQRMAVMEQQAHVLAGRPFGLASPKQLGEVLFDELKLPGGKRTPSGTWGTDASVLQTLAEQGHDLPQRVLEWRQLAKLKSTYADALVEEINPATGRVHTSYAMAATSTGRISSNDPNLQNIPIRTPEGALIRRAFVAEPGHVLVSADYSQIELRLLAHVADIPALRDAFAQGQDIHARTASEVFGIPLAEMDSVTRRRAKAINFGIIYGISAFGLARQLGIDPGEARNYIVAYFERYPGIRAYMERTKEEARINGYVLTPFGRRCYIAGIADRNIARRAGAERQAINAPLQGGAADIIKRAMVRLPAALEASGLSARLLLTVHDELLFEAAVGEASALAAVAKNVMESAASLTVPLVVETGIGLSWGEAH